MDERMPFPMQPGGGYGRMVEFHHGAGGGFHWAIFVLLLLLVLLVAAQLAATLLRSRRRGPMWKMGPGPWGGPPDPLAFARMRYARGEIDRETFVQLTQDLGGDPGAPPPAPA